MKTSSALPRFYVFLCRLTGWLAIAVAAFLLLVPAHAAPLSPDDEKGIRAVVEGQLAALAKDDAVKAFSFAAPNVRQAVGTAPQFLAMVRNRYPVIYRPASAAFLKPEDHHGQALQRVQVMDASGNAWLAIYSLQRQKDKTWRITGCSVVANKGRMA
ncbi:MAG: DUF4864 domain-containing protein [Polaromonas sp.]